VKFWINRIFRNISKNIEFFKNNKGSQILKNFKFFKLSNNFNLYTSGNIHILGFLRIIPRRILIFFFVFFLIFEVLYDFYFFLNLEEFQNSNFLKILCLIFFQIYAIHDILSYVFAIETASLNCLAIRKNQQPTNLWSISTGIGQVWLCLIFTTLTTILADHSGLAV
jgi:hypothetical protein